MYYKEISKDELENLYAGEGITSKELRYLKRTNPNKLVNIFTEEFKKQLNILKSSELSDIELRGFLHSPTKNIHQLFNQIHYILKSKIGYYEIALLSPSPFELIYAIPIIIPKVQIIEKNYNKAHFAKVVCNNRNLRNFGLKKDARFLISMELTFLGFDELFNFLEPEIGLKDLKEMFNERFNTNKNMLDSIIYWLFSSPEYQGRKGGNSFSPIHSNENKYRCDKRELKDFHKDLLNFNLPFFTKKKPIPAKFEYLKTSTQKLTFNKCSNLQYRFETKLDKARDFLKVRNSYKGIPKTSELSFSTDAIDLSYSISRPIEDFITKPILQSEILSLTEIPLFIEKGDINIDKKEKEIFDYSFDILQFVYLNSKRVPRTQINALDAVETLNDVNNEIRNDMPELYDLMNHGIIFDNSMIRGFGEHVIRISHAIFRSTARNTIDGSLELTKNLYSDIFTRLHEVLPIDKLHFYLEEAKFEKFKQKSYVLRDTINSIFFELETKFPDGWTYQNFENMIKKRTDLTKSKILEYFNTLINEREILEKSPGLYHHIVGFDRYL